MNEKWLNRDDAPLGPSVWQFIDSAVKTEISNQLTVRRLLPIEGPYGLGFKALPQSDQLLEDESSAAVSVCSAPAIPVSMLSSGFRLASRDIALMEESGLHFDLEPVIRSAIAVARKEDELLLYGSGALGMPGLLNATGVHHVSISAWKNMGQALEEVSTAVSRLESAGFYGPYTLGLTPDLYSRLFRLYPQTAMTELAHLRLLVTGGIIKSPAIRSGGVLVAVGSGYAAIALGQDIMVGFEGPQLRDYLFTISETLALRLAVPQSICVLTAS